MTVDATMPKRSVDPTSVPKSFNSDTVCEMSVNDVLAPQPLDSIATAQPTSQAVRGSLQVDLRLFNITTLRKLKRRLITHKLNTEWAVGMVSSVEKKTRC